MKRLFSSIVPGKDIDRDYILLSDLEMVDIIAPYFFDEYDNLVHNREDPLCQTLYKLLGCAEHRGQAFMYALEEGAKPPKKGHVSDAGYDLELVSLEKRDGQFYVYNTGVAITKMPRGWSLDLVARSSLYKSGFVMNGIGIIDPDSAEISEPFFTKSTRRNPIFNCRFVVFSLFLERFNISGSSQAQPRRLLDGKTRLVSVRLDKVY